MSYSYDPYDPADIYAKHVNAPRNESYDHFPASYTNPRHHGVAAFGIGAAIGAFMGYNNLRFPRGFFIRLLLMIASPIAFFGWLFWQESKRPDARMGASAQTIAGIRWGGAFFVIAFIAFIAWILRDWFRQMSVNQAAQVEAATEEQRQQERAQVQALFQQARQQEAAVQHQAQATGKAVVDAMRDAVRQEAAQSPSAPSRARNNVIDAPALPPAPQSPTGPSQRPSAPPPAPPAPMGTSTSPLWVPTYHGKAKPVQRTETSLSGTVMRDRRSVDPDTL